MGFHGRTVPFSPPRRVLLDMLRLAQEVPSVPVQRRMRIAEVVRARGLLGERPSWQSVFLRAFALVSMEFPALRRVYLGGWRPRLYESRSSVCMVAVEREYAGEPVVFIGRIPQPEQTSLFVINEQIRRFQESPIDEIGAFRRTILLGRLPGLLRRWILRRRFAGVRRARRCGTFGVSVYSALGAESLHPLAPVTCLLNYGVIDSEGEVTVRVTYDHRVVDGAEMARALARLEAVMKDQIVDELTREGTGNTEHGTMGLKKNRIAIREQGDVPTNHWFSDACAKAFWDQKEGRPYRQLVADTIDWAKPRAGEHWLDLGCGSGELSKALWLRSQGTLERLACLDCAEANRQPIGRLGAKFARDTSAVFRFIHADFSNGLAAFDEGSLDGVVSGLSISYAESIDPATGAYTREAFQRLLSDVRRILKPTGRFVFSINVPDPKFWRIVYGSLGRGLRISKPIRQMVNAWRMLRYGRWLRQQARIGRFHYPPIERLREMLREAGFDGIEHRLSYAGQAYVVRALPAAAGHGRQTDETRAA